jgi:hypothetical protein
MRKRTKEHLGCMGRANAPTIVLRALAWLTTTLVGLALIVTIGLPLALRGPVLAAFVKYESRGLCGSVTVKGGHLGLGAVLALVGQRPFDIALDGARITEPEGNDLLRAGTIRLRLAVLRHPWRLVVDRAYVADGAWRLVDPGKGIPTIVAFRPLPARGRGACREPNREPRAPKKRKPVPIGSLILVRETTLENISLLLSFTDWEVAINTLEAHDSFQLRGTSQGLRILFDARGVVAKRGGFLRIGKADNPSLDLPFDRIEIPRVAVTEAAPQNLELAVAEARTGLAVLSGNAIFNDIFPQGPERPPPGMSLTARWQELGHALIRDPRWADLARRLDLLHVEARTTLSGPFKTITGSAGIAGKGVSVDIGILRQQRFTLKAAFRHFDTTPLLEPAQRALLGGQLDGRFAVSGRLSTSVRDTSVVLDAAELALARHHVDAQPQRWVVSRSRAASSRQQLWVTLGPVTLRRGALVFDPLRVQAPGVALAARLRAERVPTGQRDDRRDPSGYLVRAWIERDSRVTVRGETFFLPPFLRVAGDPTGEVAIKPFTIRHRGGGSIDAGGTIRRDGPVDLHVAVREYPLAQLPGLSSAHAPGQPASVAVGQVLRGGLNAALDLRGTEKHPSLSGQLQLSDVSWEERALGGGTVVFDGMRDGTRFQGPLLHGIALRGQLARDPRPQDFVGVTLRDLPLAGWLPPSVAPLGLHASGEVVWRPRTSSTGDSSTVAELVVRGAGVDAQASARIQPGGNDATVKARVALAPLRAAFPALRLRQASGAITADLHWRGAYAGRAPQLDGAVVVRDALSLWPSAVGAPLEIPRTRLIVSGDEVRVPGLVVRAAGAQATLAGTLRMSWADPAASALAGTINLVVEGSQVGRIISDARNVSSTGASGSGSANFSAAVSGSVRRPHLHGEARFQALTVNWPGSPVGAVRLDGPLAIDDRRLTVGPLLVRFESGGWVRISGSRGPGRLVLTPRLAPLRISDIDIAVRGAELATLRPTGGVSVHGLSLSLRATERRDQIVRVAGAVQLGHISYHREKQSSKSAPKHPPNTPANGPRVLDRIRADHVQIFGPSDAIKAKVHYVPTVTVGVRCVVDGPLSSPRITGQINGAGIFSRLALSVADLFTSRDLHKCDLGPH